MNARLFLIAMIAGLSTSMSAQIEYKGGELFVNNAPSYQNYGLYLTNWKGFYWTYPKANDNTKRFLEMDLAWSNPRIGGTGDQIVFYTSSTHTYNSIQVSNVYNYSDARAKTNIQTLTTGLDDVLALHPVTYNWKTNAMAKTRSLAAVSDTLSAYGPQEDKAMQYGFLAQEVEKVMPDVVKTDESGRKLINYTAIIPVLVQAVQELKQTVDNQQATINELTAKLNLTASTQPVSNGILSCTPNPVTSIMQVKLGSAADGGNSVLNLSDLSGNVISRVAANGASATIDMSNLKSGMYILSLYSEGKLCDTRHIVKE